MVRKWPFGAAYGAAGLPDGLVLTSVVFGLLTKQMSVGPVELGQMLAATLLPWLWLKPVAGIFVDRLRGRSLRLWLAAAWVSMGAIVALLPLSASLGGPRGIFWALMVYNVLRSMQDVAVDGCAARLMSPAERQAVQGWMWTINTIGLVIGGPVVYRAEIPLETACYGIAVLTVVAGLLNVAGLWSSLATMTTAEPTAVKTTSAWASLWRKAVVSLGAIGGFLKSAYLPLLVGLLSYAGGERLISHFTSGDIYSVLNYSDAAVSVNEAVYFIGLLVGALVGGMIFKRRSVKWRVAVSTLLVAAVFVAIGLLRGYWPSVPVFTAMVGLLAIAGNVHLTQLCALMMPFARGSSAATRFAVLMTAINFSAWLGQKLGPWMTDHLLPAYGWEFTYPALFIAAGVLILFCLIPLWWLRLPKED